MPIHRFVSGTDIQLISAYKPFSGFDFIEDNYGEFISLRRLFSLARSHGFKSFTIESITAKGIISEENDEISELFTDYSMGVLQRLAFWDISLKNVDEIKRLENKSLIGYAILKQDSHAKLNLRWHIFESVFKKYAHHHNCVPNSRNYKVKIAGKQFTMHGVMYCQQNELNKSCAQVALRALLDGLPSVGNLSYAKINQLAESPSRPSSGLGPPQIQKVLRGLDIQFRAIDYANGEEKGCVNPMRKTHPYRKFVYSGVESGLGALLGFSLAKDGFVKNEQPKHIIPFFGHTFNKDTWVPDAALNYFEIGSNIGYIPSDNWTSSFIGHDDNFGSDFCVPKLYIKRDQVDYVVELLKPKTTYSGVQAEALSLIYLYSLFSEINKSKNRWMRRLASSVDTSVKEVVLRAVSLTSDEYISHLKSTADWDGNKEDAELIKVFIKKSNSLLPSNLWMIEISIPHLFQANERKLGEIILDAGKSPATTVNDVDFSLFVMARLPENYYFIKTTKNNKPEFLNVPSQIQSHVSLLMS